MFGVLFNIIQGIIGLFTLFIVVLALYVGIQQFLESMDLDKKIGRKD